MKTVEMVPCLRRAFSTLCISIAVAGVPIACADRWGGCVGIMVFGAECILFMLVMSSQGPME